MGGVGGESPDSIRAQQIASSVPFLLIAAFVVSLSGRWDISIPGTPVPQSAQTLAVVLVGSFLGARRGSLAVIVYLLAGAIGLPVFADGAGGAEHLVGPTAGYLFGFVAAAGLTGWYVARTVGRAPFVGTLVVMVLAHILILGGGWIRLSAVIGTTEAYAQGVMPFLIGGLAKSLIAALIVVAATQGKKEAAS